MMKPYNLNTLVQFELFCIEQRRIDKTVTAETIRQRWSDLPQKVETLRCNGEPADTREQDREIDERNRIAMPGAIRRNKVWSRKRHDIVDYHTAQQQTITTSVRPI